MAKVKCGISVSVDNCAAGHHMTEEHPFGDMPQNLLHHWQLDEPEKHKAVTDGIQSALEQARAAAGERDVNVMGGADTVNQFLRAGLLDELWLHVAPIVYGDGKRLFEGVSMQGLEVLDVRSTPVVTHVRYGLKRG